MEHDRQMALKTEADKVAARKKLLEVQRGALHAQMQERESLKREVSEIRFKFEIGVCQYSTHLVSVAQPGFLRGE